MIGLYILIIVIVFTGISLWRGGDWLRQGGAIISRTTEEVARIADGLYNCRKGFERFCDRVKKKTTGIFKKDEGTNKGK